MNTKIGYLYRDADNYKVWNEAVINGTLNDVQKQIIRKCLYDGEYFIPCAVGLPEKTFVSLGYSYDEQADHPFFELSMSDINVTYELPTVSISARRLTRNFIRMRNKWAEFANERTRI
ncbi:hypothetical protein [Ructibacterium gallinarum]|uniref:Uncharacterized protein n=1 Tax=Ructibacterium gallinarum TaxID=2779355 RepID=A0A9D5M4H0_9FIRM|nr:hypothetical protein [Ructibacterium gallinarum]MBE5040544.1 hypothetical protein [Ructibacterium gallinarum]